VVKSRAVILPRPWSSGRGGEQRGTGSPPTSPPPCRKSRERQNHVAGLGGRLVGYRSGAPPRCPGLMPPQVKPGHRHAFTNLGDAHDVPVSYRHQYLRVPHARRDARPVEPAQGTRPLGRRAPGGTCPRLEPDVRAPRSSEAVIAAFTNSGQAKRRVSLLTCVVPGDHTRMGLASRRARATARSTLPPGCARRGAYCPVCRAAPRITVPAK
jgi:hypothetical protein